jgi:hypothetical protein
VLNTTMNAQMAQCRQRFAIKLNLTTPVFSSFLFFALGVVEIVKNPRTYVAGLSI